MKNEKEIKTPELKANEMIAYLVTDPTGRITTIEAEPIEGYQSYHPETGLPYGDSHRTSEMIILSGSSLINMWATDQGIAVSGGHGNHSPRILNSRMISNTTSRGYALHDRDGVKVYRVTI